MKMIDVGAKPATERIAVATSQVRMLPATLSRIRSGEIEKGDVLTAARLAGVMGAKRTPELVPLCHPISLSSVELEVEPVTVGVEIRATVKTVDRTGVEMEALTAVCAAALTVYDMCKSYDRRMTIEAVQLEHKSGGRTGTWTRAEQRAESEARQSRAQRPKAAEQRQARRSEVAGQPKLKRRRQ